MRKTILAVDDSIALRMFIQKTLAQHPDEFTLHLAKDATEGLTKASSTNPDLVLLDYILPEMTGSDVCSRLQENEATANIPVVLMSSNVQDIKRAESQFKSIVKSIAKPFTPDLLTSTVRYVLRSIEEKAEGEAEVAQVAAQEAAAPAPVGLRSEPKGAKAASPTKPSVTGKEGTILFQGHSDFFPLYRAFLGVQESSLTGILRLKVEKDATEIHIHGGRPLMNTTLDGETYMGAGAYPLTPVQAVELAAAMARQSKDGQPVFVTFAEADLMSDEQMEAACREQGAKLLSNVWTAGRVHFEFEAMDSLPDLHGPIKAFSGGMDAWMLESLRHVGDQALSALAWGDLSGVPIYTRHGYERIQQIKLTREEANFLGQVGSSTLAEMATAVKISPERAQEILFRFLSLEIFEYWPAAVLRGEA